MPKGKRGAEGRPGRNRAGTQTVGRQARLMSPDRAYQLDCLWRVATRLQGQAIRREHDIAEAMAHEDWYAWSQHVQAARELRHEAAACFAAAR